MRIRILETVTQEAFAEIPDGLAGEELQKAVEEAEHNAMTFTHVEQVSWEWSPA